jgi:hypothetical protein
MPKLAKQDWEKLKADKVAFSAMPQKLFKSLLDKVYASGNTGEFDDTDALMIYLARAEPPIQPAPPDK